MHIDSKFNYKLSEESFQVYVPKNYVQEAPYGLLVWVNAASHGATPAAWYPVFDKHKMIAIGANNSGNKRKNWNRIGLALDAVYNMKKLYSIDENRVYIAGISGGGRTASVLAIAYPDIFKGGLFIVGCIYFKKIPNPKKMKTWWPPIAPHPPGKFYQKMKNQNRFVLFTGQFDFNRAETEAIYQQYKKDSFNYVFYYEVPNKGHAPPDATWFEKCLISLDKSKSILKKTSKNKQ